MNYNEILDHIRADIVSKGINTDDILIADGLLHRAHHNNDKRGTMNISYIIHMDAVPSWYFEYFPASIKFTGTLSGKQRKLSLSERKQIEAERKIRQSERKQRQKEAADRARTIWSRSELIEDAGQHPYLIRKGIKPYRARLYKGAVIIPIYNESRELVNLQFIDADGNKRFMPGGKKKDCFSVIGDSSKNTKLMICEGYATGASLHAELGLFVMVAMDAGNLEPVAQAARRMYPDVEIIIAGDNDESSTGQAAAQKAARAAGGKYLIPDKPGMDWNDVLTEGGAA